MKSFLKYIVILPTVILLLLVIGFLAGNHFSNNILLGRKFYQPGSKINAVLGVINNYYVDTIVVKDLAEEAIPSIINELDPHSSYIPAQDLEAVNDDIDGHFSGIGIEFSRQNDTIIVISIVSGGPSEKVGIQPGDRIVTIDDSLYAGTGFSDEKIIKTLRGTKGTKVSIGVKRANREELQIYEITRGDVPRNTVDVAYEVSKGTGLIKINKFGRSTYTEFLNALGLLINAGCESFILDLRQNPGGLLDVAINVANEFLSKDQLIVYTEGKAFSRTEAYANGTGMCQTSPLVVLVDEMAASASEIVAGAIQDNDRGTIIGRRSFGKGLVQNQIELGDGSALRLTVARYYTPSGRCIQKAYQMGNGAVYEQELVNRFVNGEFDHRDSIKTSEAQFKTLLGRTVFDGGGIMPDIFIPRDTIGITSYYLSLLQNGIIHEYTLRYTDEHRETLTKFKDYRRLWNYLKTQPLLNGIVSYAAENGIRPRPTLIDKSAPLIENLAHAYIIRNIFGNPGFYPVILFKDPVVMKAVEVIRKGEAFPKNESED
ncbi:MAG: S41 family peptidase [Dysgonamonadaceae bacterium]|jgi:carboxyl-terminal processing protease|nr:S41 family peptidase [Dysgonamonadaceae bacterium]